MQNQKTNASSTRNNAFGNLATLYLKGREVVEKKPADHKGRFLTDNQDIVRMARFNFHVNSQVWSE